MLFVIKHTLLMYICVICMIYNICTLKTGTVECIHHAEQCVHILSYIYHLTLYLFYN